MNTNEKGRPLEILTRMRTTLYVTPSMKEKIEHLMNSEMWRTRNEFIIQCIRYYIENRSNQPFWKKREV